MVSISCFSTAVIIWITVSLTSLHQSPFAVSHFLPVLKKKNFREKQPISKFHDCYKRNSITEAQGRIQNLRGKQTAERLCQESQTKAGRRTPYPLLNKKQTKGLRSFPCEIYKSHPTRNKQSSSSCKHFCWKCSHVYPNANKADHS